MKCRTKRFYPHLILAAAVAVLSANSLTEKAHVDATKRSIAGVAITSAPLIPATPLTAQDLSARNPNTAQSNIAGLIQTFNNPSNVLSFGPIADAGPAPWTGLSSLPNLQFDSSGCSVQPMYFVSQYFPMSTLPTVWCGAVSSLGSKASAGLPDTTPANGPGGSGSSPLLTVLPAI